MFAVTDILHTIFRTIFYIFLYVVVAAKRKYIDEIIFALHHFCENHIVFYPVGYNATNYPDENHIGENTN